jgi:hypothetical protein
MQNRTLIHVSNDLPVAEGRTNDPDSFHFISRKGLRFISRGSPEMKEMNPATPRWVANRASRG